MENLKPKVSIIVPVYNVEKYLHRCMDSLINQTLKDIEIIAVNDGSTDNSLEILNKYAERDTRIKIIDKKNGGLSSARNAALDIVIGEYVSFVDSDDWINQNMLKKLYTKAKKEKCDTAITSYVREYEQGSKPKKFNLDEVTIYNEEEVKNQLYRRLIGPLKDETGSPEHLDSLVMACAKLYKTSIIKDNNIRFIDTYKIGTEDCLFNIYVFNYAKKTIFINQPYYHYWKDNKNSLTTIYKANLIDKWLTMYGYIEDFLDRNNADEIFYVALTNRIAMSTLGLGLNECSKGNHVSVINKINNLKRILTDEKISYSLSKLDLSYLPIHWKIFYLINKNKLATLSYLMLNVINLLRRLL